MASTGLRDRAINTILASPSVTASSEAASLGWFTPLSVRGLALTSSNKRVDIRLEDMGSDRSPLRLLSTAPDLGTIRVSKPHVRLVLPLDVDIQGARHRLEPTFTAVATDAALTVYLVGQDEPVLEVDGIDLTARVENTEDGRVLSLDPLVVFDRRKLTPKLAKTLVYLFDPTLANTPDVTGEVSLSLDKLRVPLGVPKEDAIKRMEVEGKVTLHRVASDFRNPTRQAVVHLVAALNGKQPTEVVRLAQDAEIRFRVKDGRLHHEGLRLGFPDIDPDLVVTSHGSVGLDKSLDLHVELPRLDKAQRAAKGPARCRITGTVDSPKIAVADASLVLRQHDRTVPIIAADGMTLTMQVETTPAGAVLAVDPVEVFKRAKLNVVAPNGLVSLIVPDVEVERQVTGEVSLALSRVRIPLGGGPDQLGKGLEAEGTLTLHDVTTEVKKPMWQAVTKLLADMSGKPPSNVVRLADGAEIRFRVKDGRLHHEGLRIGFPGIDPDLVVTSRGSIGTDETLDLHVELPRLDKAQRAAKGPARCHITGTIDNPKIAVEDASLVLRQHDRAVPIIAADGMTLTMQVETTPAGAVLAVDPVEVFKRAKLNVVAPNGLVSLIVPDVEVERQVTGEVSLALSRVRIPLGGGPDQLGKGLEAEGTLTLHDVTTEVKKPMWQAVTKLLADMSGKPPSNVVRLADGAEIRFRVKDGRLHHEGLRIGFPGIDPDLVVTSRGSIGTDETLDLHVELPRLRKDKRDGGPVKCHVTGTLSDPKIAVPDASLVVQLTETGKAALTVENVNLVFGVETSKAGRVLTLAPVTVLEKRKVTPEVGDQLLKLIAPTLSDLSGVQGELSLSFDTFRVPLGVPKAEAVKRVELAGKLHLHQITVSTKTPLVQTTVKLLADMYGKQPSDVVRIVKNAEVRFQVREGRVHHEGMRFGFPDISPDLIALSRGSVGFDSSLDLELEVPRLVLKKKDAPAPKALPPVRFRITGTIDTPVVTEIKQEKDKPPQGAGLDDPAQLVQVGSLDPVRGPDTDPTVGTKDESRAPPVEIKAVIRISRQLIDDVVAHKEVEAAVPYRAKVLGFSTQGVIDGTGKLSVDMSAVEGDGVFIVNAQGSAQTFVRGVRGPVVATGTAWGPFTSRTLVRFDGRNFSVVETTPWSEVHGHLDRVEGRRGGPIGRIAGRLAMPVGRRLVPRAEREATPIANYLLANYANELGGKISARLNQRTAVERSLARLFPETKDWGFQLSTHPQYIQAAYGPRGSAAPVLPDNPGRPAETRLELWLRTTTKEAQSLEQLTRRPLAKQLVQRYLEATLPELAALTEERTVHSIGQWLVLSIGVPKPD
ncbi:hypothetical protein [Urbifossiella limnaea]|uniref:DUF748 domain-containing protein n=1 Tax=Urbifossiella limnaea TaxID=2528023 RepID=A0A517XNE5_9BACT|nr:hypothetical protein [Urbifossiella limnaea]QDU19017.1 hypothetical protein ETAA1_09190 [Urbifossiella limnaea]